MFHDGSINQVKNHVTGMVCPLGSAGALPDGCKFFFWVLKAQFCALDTVLFVTLI